MDSAPNFLLEKRHPSIGSQEKAVTVADVLRKHFHREHHSPFCLLPFFWQTAPGMFVLVQWYLATPLQPLKAEARGLPACPPLELQHQCMLPYADGTQQAWAGTLPSPATRLMPRHMKSRGDLPPQLMSWLLLPGSISVITVPMRSEEGEQDPGRATHSPGISQHQGLVA